MKTLFSASLLVCWIAVVVSDSAIAQNASRSERPAGSTERPAGQAKTKDASKPKLINPFDTPPPSEMMAGGMGMMGEMEMEMGGMESAMSGYGSAGGGMMGMMEMSDQPSANQRFRRGLQRAIASLKNASNDQEREALRGFVRDALAKRYETMIRDRKRDLERLKQSVAKLEGDLKRREAAKDRVVQVQMQSVQLASEGLLELTELQGVSPGGIYGGGDDYMGDDGQ